jgi:hypothetical protein
MNGYKPILKILCNSHKKPLLPFPISVLPTKSKARLQTTRLHSGRVMQRRTLWRSALFAGPVCSFQSDAEFLQFSSNSGLSLHKRDSSALQPTISVHSCSGRNSLRQSGHCREFYRELWKLRCEERIRSEPKWSNVLFANASSLCCSLFLTNIEPPGQAWHQKVDFGTILHNIENRLTADHSKSDWRATEKDEAGSDRAKYGIKCGFWLLFHVLNCTIHGQSNGKSDSRKPLSHDFPPFLLSKHFAGLN